MKPSSTTEVRDLYDETADHYSEMMESEISLPIYAESLERLRNHVSELDGAVVDTACGSGHMLSMYRSQFDSQRTLIGMDLSPRMVSIARTRLGQDTQIFVGDMRNLKNIESGFAAALLNWYAIHHLSLSGAREAIREWHRVLAPGGLLMVAAWEGAGEIDYGESSDIVAFRYTGSELSALAGEAGFNISRCTVEPVDDFPMDAVHLECIKPLQPNKSLKTDVVNGAA